MLKKITPTFPPLLTLPPALLKIISDIPKIIPALALLLGTLVAPNASAWEEVCVDFTGGLHSSGKFYVVYGFDEGELPTSYFTEAGEMQFLPDWTHPLGSGYADSTSVYPFAEGRVKSDEVRVGTIGCVPMRRVRLGEPFFVYVEYLTALVGESRTPIYSRARCPTHHSNPDWWYYQQNRPYRKIMFKTDMSGEAACTYWRETN